MQVLLPYVLAVIINANNEVLLAYRKNSEWFNDHYCLIGGKIDDHESARQALIREIFEETGLVVELQAIEFAHVMHFMGETRPCVAFFFIVRTWKNDVVNKEPDKHDHLKWFSLAQLPNNLIPRHRRALELILKNEKYSDSFNTVSILAD